MTLQQRIINRSIPHNGCWLWTAARDRKGYARLNVDGKNRQAHRISYEVFCGPIPPGLTLDHLCFNRGCVNPAHLEPVTHRENLRRGRGVGVVNAAKTHCPKGHLYDEDNTLYTARGHRQCRTCRAAHSKARDWAADYQRRKARASA